MHHFVSLHVRVVIHSVSGLEFYSLSYLFPRYLCQRRRPSLSLSLVPSVPPQSFKVDILCIRMLAQQLRNVSGLQCLSWTPIRMCLLLRVQQRNNDTTVRWTAWSYAQDPSSLVVLTQATHWRAWVVTISPSRTRPGRRACWGADVDTIGLLRPEKLPQLINYLHQALGAQ